MQKLVLNTISTIAMVRVGKTFGNLMVDVQASNDMLRARERRAVAIATAAPVLDEARRQQRPTLAITNDPASPSRAQPTGLCRCTQARSTPSQQRRRT